jgi:hypothetical protein
MTTTKNTGDKKFIQIDIDGNIVREYNSKNPRSAALKAATQDESNIILVDCLFGKIHVFDGSKELLTEGQKNSFTESKNIQTRPYVRKLAYSSLNRKVNLKCEDDKKIVSETVNALIYN